MNENMNRFGFNTEGKICDYGEEEPKVLREQEMLEELNHLENTKNHFWEECEDMNWQNECLQEQVEVLEKALELARKDLREMYCSDYCGKKYEEKYCYENCPYKESWGDDYIAKAKRKIRLSNLIKEWEMQNENIK